MTTSKYGVPAKLETLSNGDRQALAELETLSNGNTRPTIEGKKGAYQFVDSDQLAITRQALAELETLSNGNTRLTIEGKKGAYQFVDRKEAEKMIDILFEKMGEKRCLTKLY